MKKIILATHGTLADGFKNTLELISGPQPTIITMNFYHNDDCYEPKIKEIFDQLTNQEQLIICTDIQYGSVNQLFVKEAIKQNKKNIHIISGINLPLLLEIVATHGIISDEDFKLMVKKAAKQVSQVDYESLLNENNNDFFPEFDY